MMRQNMMPTEVSCTATAIPCLWNSLFKPKAGPRVCKLFRPEDKIFCCRTSTNDDRRKVSGIT